MPDISAAIRAALGNLPILCFVAISQDDAALTKG
jgi:hypothetical protein